MRAAWLVAVNDLRVQLRRGTILVLGFVAPLALAFVMNLVFGGVDDGSGPTTFDVAVVDHDGGEEADGFVGVLRDVASSGLLDLTSYDDEDAARAALDDGDVGAIWIVPDGFSDAVRAGTETGIEVVGDVDAPTTASVARAIARGYASNVGLGTMAATTAIETGVATPEDAASVAEEAAAAGSPVTLVDATADTRLLDMSTNLMAGMALFFVFFTSGLPVLGILEERDQGTLHRLLAAPIPAWSITAGKVLSAAILGSLSLWSLMAASSVLMGAEWGPPIGAALLAVAGVVAAIGIMSVAGSIARSTEQAGNAQGIVAVVFAILGGAFVPIPGGSGGVLGLLQQLTPHGWFFDGVADLRHDGVAGAAPALAVLLAMGLLTGAVGLWLSRWVLRR
ncbi:ABC transporter permease [Actinomarinicola tropica]|uniref:ABC transporter permease subunit n=1 Tax=Actinomarinicola tropica TaxID=2789776 RepID=A0A5Q2RN80_9ACTN|nr:ABC transporter permease [Actinomarinicola tropica]QGG96864.1 ABC transporter permease subunit [Actinomarinicola tropica]